MKKFNDIKSKIIKIRKVYSNDNQRIYLLNLFYKRNERKFNNIKIKISIFK